MSVSPVTNIIYYGTVDMFSLEEIQDIVEYSQIYIKNHKNGD